MMNPSPFRRTMNPFQFRRSYSLLNRTNRIHMEDPIEELRIPLIHKKNPILLPHRTMPHAKGQDLDFINVVHSHLIHSDWDKINKLESCLSPFRVKHILLKTRKDYVLSYEFYKWIEGKNAELNTVDVNSIVLHILTKNRKFKSAESILRKILEEHSLDLGFPRKFFEALVYSYRMCESSPRIFDALFKTYAHMKKFRNATDAFCWMREYGFYPTVESCNAYLSQLNVLNRADIALRFYKEMCKSHISPNVYTVNMIISAFCKVGNLEKAAEVYKEMEGMGLVHNNVTCNTLISGYCGKGLLSSALKLKNLMEKEGLQPNVITYNTLINALCKEKKLHEASKIFSEMKSKKVCPSVVTYNTLINGYSESGNCEMGRQLFEDMLGNGIKADILTYSAMIKGLCREGKTKKAAYLVQELDKEKLVPNASTFAALITGQCVINNAERAFQLYKSMVKSGCHPNDETFKNLISAFIKKEDYGRAVQVLEEMMDRGMILDSDMLSCLCNGLNRCGREKMVADLLQEIESRHLMPDDYKKLVSVPPVST